MVLSGDVELADHSDTRTRAQLTSVNGAGISLGLTDQGCHQIKIPSADIWDPGTTYPTSAHLLGDAPYVPGL